MFSIRDNLFSMVYNIGADSTLSVRSLHLHFVLQVSSWYFGFLLKSKDISKTWLTCLNYEWVSMCDCALWLVTTLSSVSPYLCPETPEIAYYYTVYGVLLSSGSLDQNILSFQHPGLTVWHWWVTVGELLSGEQNYKRVLAWWSCLQIWWYFITKGN